MMKNQRHVARTLGLSFCATGIASAASAEIIELEPGSGPASQVQDAIDAAEDGDIIRLGAGTWIWGVDYEQLDLGGKAITLEGEGGTVISLALKSEYTPAIVVQSGEDQATTIRDLVFEGLVDTAANALLVSGAHPTVDGCTFRDLDGWFQPAISVVDGGLTMLDCEFLENEMGNSGIISVVDSELNILDSSFTDCGLYNTVRANGSQVEINNTQFERTLFANFTRRAALELIDCCGTIDDCDFRGLETLPFEWENAAISLYNIETPNDVLCISIQNSTFDDLESNNQSSAIGTSVPIVVAACSFNDCRGPGANGGAVGFFRGGVVAGCTFTECYSYHGGALGASGDTIVWGCTFTDNGAYKGGGVFSILDPVFMLDCRFVGNTAQQGGAAWVSLNARGADGVDHPVAMYGCDFDQNQTSKDDGAVGFGYEVGPVMVERCTFSGNLDEDGNPEAFGYPDEDEEWERYEILVKDSLFCPALASSRRYMTDLGGNLIDIRCPGEATDSILLAVDGKPLGWFWNDFFGWLQWRMQKDEIHLFDPRTGGMQEYFNTYGDWAVQPRIDAFARLDERHLLFSFASNGQPLDLEGAPESGGVKGSDILMFTATEFGEITRGAWSFYFDGSDVGLAGNRGNIDALAVEPDGSLLISLQGNVRIEGLGLVDDASVLRFRPTSLGADTRGTWELAFGPSYSRFNAASEDIDALAIFDTGPDWMRLVFSSVGTFSVDGVNADDEDVLEYTWFPGLPTAPAGSIGIWADGLDDLLLQGAKADISALEWVADW